MFIDPASDASPAANSARQRPLYSVRRSSIHGNGVFAARKIAAGTRIIEYEGDRITAKQASKRHEKKDGDIHHTFFFSLENGRVIDGDSNGNDARWINHACDPNCEAIEEDGHVFIYALRDIRRGEELGYDYKLFLDVRHTATLKRSFACRCGAESCRGTMLMSKRKTGKKSKA